MAEPYDRLQELGFFGGITASVTHEMKNYLALINEYNGLLCDLVMAHETGGELNLARLKSLCGDIKRQVVAGGLLLDYLNGFAHCVDQPVRAVDLGQYLELFVALCRRNAGRQGVELALEPLIEACTLQTQPFTLLRGLAQCLELALAGCQPGGRLTVRTVKDDDWACVELAGGGPVEGDQARACPSQALLHALGARFRQGAQGGLLLCLPLGGVER